MDDLISRQAVIDAIDRIARTDNWQAAVSMALLDLPSAHPEKFEWCTDCKEYDHEKHCCPRFNKAIRRTVEELKAQPKTGHWVEIGDEPYDEWECDRCGFVIDGSGCIDPEEYRDIYIFCPHCGSMMLKEGETHD